MTHRTLTTSAVVVVASATLAFFAGGVARSQTPAEPTAERELSTQLVVLPDDLGAAVVITDERALKMWVYSSEDDHLELRESYDLSNAGQQTIPRLRLTGSTTLPAR